MELSMRIGIIFFIFASFTFHLHAQYNSVGTDSTIDILAWNIENFPKNGSSTINEVASIVSDLQADLIGVEEIASVSDFNSLLTQLPGWDGILSPHEYSPGEYQKVGILFNSQVVTVNSYQLIFEDDSYAFPRPPMEFFLNTSEGGFQFDFRMIILHLKAYSGDENEARRRAAIESLKGYIDQEKQFGEEKDFVLLGDFNDHLEDPPEDNVFTVLLDDPDNYTFLTEPLVGSQGSYIGLNEPNLIDHICITSDALTEYGEVGQTQVLYLDSQNPSYESIVSDHRPVFSQFAFDNQSGNNVISISQIHEQFSQYEGHIVKIEGVVTIASGIFSPLYTSAYIQDNSEAGINIYYSDGIITDLQQGNLVELEGQVENYNGLPEIVYESHQLIDTNQPLPEPFLISTNSINAVDDNPGRWIQVTGQIESISVGPHINMMINEGSGAGNIYFDPDAGLNISKFTIGEYIKITGVKTVFNNTGQVQPGYQEDIQDGNPSTYVDNGNLPAQFGLFQNYPNPFNNKTIIQYQVEATGMSPFQVNLSIYNLLGQKVVTLVSEKQPAGLYKTEWDATGFNSGIYIYKLNLGDQIINTRRMLLIK